MGAISLIKILVCNSGGLGAVLIVTVVVGVAQIAILMPNLLTVEPLTSNNQILAL